MSDDLSSVVAVMPSIFPNVVERLARAASISGGGLMLFKKEAAVSLGEWTLGEPEGKGGLRREVLLKIVAEGSFLSS